MFRAQFFLPGKRAQKQEWKHARVEWQGRSECQQCNVGRKWGWEWGCDFLQEKRSSSWPSIGERLCSHSQFLFYAGYCQSCCLLPGATSWIESSWAASPNGANKICNLRSLWKKMGSGNFWLSLAIFFFFLFWGWWGIHTGLAEQISLVHKKKLSTQFGTKYATPMQRLCKTFSQPYIDLIILCGERCHWAKCGHGMKHHQVQQSPRAVSRENFQISSSQAFIWHHLESLRGEKSIESASWVIACRSTRKSENAAEYERLHLLPSCNNPNSPALYYLVVRWWP